MFNLSKPKFVSGFTLVEMMVSVVIITVITLVVLFDYRTFNDNLALTTAQQEISVAIRQAQIYGLSVKENKASGSSDFNSGYGIYANPTTDSVGYYLFVDQANDGKYSGTTNCTTSIECIEKNILRNGITIKQVCGTAFGGGAVDCTQGYKSMSITFLRPSSSAKIIFLKSDNTTYTGLMKTGQIQLKSSLGKIVNVTVENTGQISVQ